MHPADRPQTRTTLALLPVLPLVLALLVSGCSDNPSSGAPTRVDTLKPAGPRPPGTTRFTCEVASSEGVVTVALDLPEGFRPTKHPVDDATCSWAKLVHAPREAPGDFPFRGYVEASLTPEDDPDALRRRYEEEQPYAVEGDVPEGDDSVLHLVLERDVPALGDSRGDRLRWDCFCDGQETSSRFAQAGGVQLSWSSYWRVDDQADEWLATALSSAGTVR